jgi:hypothetical protein
MSGVMTTTVDHLIRSDLWSQKLKEIFLADLFAMRYVDMITDFPDGNVLHIPSIGQAEIQNYEEGEAIRYTAPDTGDFTFRITDYVASATYITNKMKQDSFYTDRLVAQFVPKQARAIAEAMEQGALAVGPTGQTASNLNAINGASHRYVASGTGGVLVPEDFAYARYALQMANVPMTNLVAIVDPSAEFNMNTLTNITNVSFNPRWEGIIRDGIGTGMQFRYNVYGFDVYESMFLPKGIAETINGKSVTTGVANQFFSTAGDALPFVGAVRQQPKVESEYNKDFQREEYVTTARWGFGFYRPEGLVTILSNSTVVSP